MRVPSVGIVGSVLGGERPLSPPQGACDLSRPSGRFPYRTAGYYPWRRAKVKAAIHEDFFDVLVSGELTA
jgi:hypothetical protein